MTAAASGTGGAIAAIREARRQVLAACAELPPKQSARLMEIAQELGRIAEKVQDEDMWEHIERLCT
ncbi:hypothetical protein AUQ37_02620 [Candidatus Methanomethylophilus sp. 1R26]|uniref:hypothetical protein n=1 Tax=Candidatus Methanomethylophilus sp. 1R26 TaxID=1769296 RepID=UPI0007364F47|nr:hypothetical protein [Candidatus Methanomethylophilus sp. 1R26]KUE73339.1 hypothetical protein AUQ37_02620 [Candidatus Methanomethylophilus sp. 1R26]